MFRLVGALIFCGLLVSVFSDDKATDCIFDWKTFETEGNGPDIVIDFSSEHITTLEEGDKTYHYISGDKNVRSEVGNDYKVYYLIQQEDEDDGFYDSNTVPTCDFMKDIYANYLMPIEGKHSDLPQADSICPIKEGTVQIFETDNSDDLKAPSKLPNGDYFLELSLRNDQDKPVGGFSGTFTVLRD